MKGNIVDGVWGGGTFLSEKWLCDQLRMSKTPVRSALDRLEMMGLVKLFPNQGVVVAEISLRKILEIYELRKALETYAAKKLTGKLDAAFFRRMDDNLRQQELAIDQYQVVEYVKLDAEFHSMIVAALDNEEYADAMMRMQDRFLMAVRTTFLKNRDRLRGSMEEHYSIREALAGSDPDRTERLIDAHIEYVKSVML
jgi:DNA-binding GntR family transcriptional regulator